ncbi:hypothetical protein RRG08_043990 [Elysia crispata]|uniref:Uncharacterized protein n=1 Tax=Elysia crispata TaxID=231223 RepID=A0AAE1DHG2_9GAST|nr:hypothetical protein RRG08_043990 [Elysia crispata]
MPRDKSHTTFTRFSLYLGESCSRCRQSGTLSFITTTNPSSSMWEEKEGHGISEQTNNNDMRFCFLSYRCSFFLPPFRDKLSITSMHPFRS